MARYIIIKCEKDEIIGGWFFEAIRGKDKHISEKEYNRFEEAFNKKNGID
jgi:hypothetical protein